MTDISADISASQMFTRADGVRLAYRFAPGQGPLLVFLPGYMSDMEGGKAQAVFAHAQARGQACLLLDYSGCGSSEGAFADGTLTIWCDDVLAIIDHVWPEGGVIPIGSSMGGWIALLIGLALRERAAGLIGIAAAPDFTAWGFSDEQKAALQRDGRIEEPSDYGDPYLTTLAFWESGQRNLLLEGEVALTCPVRLLHGQADDVVPWDIAVRTAERLRSADVQLMLVKDGDHRLSRDGDIALLLGLVDGLIPNS
ncbi:MAG: alpha/beta hydrolase [Sphingobium sp.]|nr:alpha/beta hydrolase [Sphingobium sp.]